VLHRRLYTIRAAIYLLVVAINLNQLFMPARWGVKTPFQGLTETYALLEDFEANNGEKSGGGLGERDLLAIRSSLIMSSALTALSLLGYGAVISNSAVTEVPMVVRAVDLGVVQVSRRRRKDKKGERWGICLFWCWFGSKAVITLR
jgi:hypothetical protein